MQINRLFNQQPPRPYLGRRATSSNNGVPGPAPPVVPHAPPIVPPAPPVVPPAPPAPPVQRPQRRYPDVSIAELMASPSRLQMPLIHVYFLFKIDKCLTDDCTSIYTSDWTGAWHNFSMVSEEMKSTWWGDFVMIANDGVEPSLPELVRKTHTFKDGTFADGRSKKIVEEVESAATERLMTDSVEETNRKKSENDLFWLFLVLLSELSMFCFSSQVVSPYKGRVYGLGSAHCYYGDSTSSTSTAIPRTMHLETRVTSVEENMKSMQGNMNSMATDIAAIMEASRRLLEANGIDPSVVLRSTTTNNSEQTHVSSPHQSPASGHQVPPTNVPSPINLADMEPQSFDGYFQTS
ncbi:hypothetical protein Bca101_043273 [Brassica carinata]